MVKPTLPEVVVTETFTTILRCHKCGEVERFIHLSWSRELASDFAMSYWRQKENHDPHELTEDHPEAAKAPP